MYFLLMIQEFKNYSFNGLRFISEGSQMYAGFAYTAVYSRIDAIL